MHKRYIQLVTHFTSQGKSTNAMKTPFDNNQTHSHTQAFYRFVNNDNVTIAELSKPILENAKSNIAAHCHEYALMVHDWSRIALNHDNKHDKLQMTHHHDVGYELQSSLVLSDKNGLPIAPIAQNLITAKAQLSTYGNTRKDTHLNELGCRMQWHETQSFDKPLLHIIDREADSAQHMRDWAQAGYRFLVRVKAPNTLTFQGENKSTQAIAEEMNYRDYKTIDYKGRYALLKVAESNITLTRKAKPKVNDSSGKRLKPQTGEPLELRLICTRIEDKEGRLLASWYLLSNTQLSAEVLAQYYHYRWQIESYFKLLKSAGHHMENWLQQSSEAFFKRALIVAQSCVLVWQLMLDQSRQAQELKTLLIRLSGRRVKYKRPTTAPALLDGYMMLLGAYELMQSMTFEEISEAVQFFQGGVGFV